MSKPVDEKRIVETAKPEADRLPLFALRTHKLAVRTGVKSGSRTLYTEA